MITKADLQGAIAECLGKRNPDANTCVKLAACYTIMENLYPQEDAGQELPRYSYSARAVDEVTYAGNTDFSQAITGKNPDDIWGIMDELMTALIVLNPRLYRSVMEKISEK